MKLGDRMKFYEKLGQPERLTPMLPTFARLDGRSFHTFTKGMLRPIEPRFKWMMEDTTRYLVEKTGAVVGYTQSDEITLCWKSDNFESQIFFSGKPQKMLSILAAMTALYFNKLVAEYFPTYVSKEPMFDCRVWTVPNINEAINVFLWRQDDCVRNSISMLAQSEFSHKQLHKKSSVQMIKMLKDTKDIDWNSYGSYRSRYGRFFKAVRRLTPFTTEELDNLPEKHAARTTPDLVVDRRYIEDFEINLAQCPDIEYALFGEEIREY